MKKPYLVCVVSIVVAGGVSAGTVEQGLAGCAGIDGEQQRLACFDALARDVALYTKAATAAQAESTAQADQPSTEAFGLEHKDPNLGGAGELHATVKGIKKNMGGRMVLILDNGQVWQQKDNKTLLLHAGDDVLIERGALSAFYLSSGGNKRIAVARVK